MTSNNPIHDAIYRNIIKPALDKKMPVIEGSLMGVDYENNTATVYWRDPGSGGERYMSDIPLPTQGEGIYKKTYEMGDHVSLAFYGDTQAFPIILNVHKKKTNFESRNGASIPKGISFL